MTDPKQDVRQQFEAAIKDAYETWCLPRMSNIDPDHPSDAFAAGYQAALQSPAVRELVEDARRYAFLRDDPPVELAVRKRERNKLDGFNYLYIDGPHLDTEIDTALRTLGAGHE